MADIDETLRNAGWLEVGKGAGVWRAPDAEGAVGPGSTPRPTPPSSRCRRKAAEPPPKPKARKKSDDDS